MSLRPYLCAFAPSLDQRGQKTGRRPRGDNNRRPVARSLSPQRRHIRLTNRLNQAPGCGARTLKRQSHSGGQDPPLPQLHPGGAHEPLCKGQLWASANLHSRTRAASAVPDLGSGQVAKKAKSRFSDFQRGVGTPHGAEAVGGLPLASPVSRTTDRPLALATGHYGAL